jgi:hypothetical protein
MLGSLISDACSSAALNGEFSTWFLYAVATEPWRLADGLFATDASGVSYIDLRLNSLFVTQ